MKQSITARLKFCWRTPLCPFALAAIGFSLVACEPDECITAADCDFEQACTSEGACINLNTDADLAPSPLPPAGENLGFPQEGRILVPYTGDEIVLVQSEGRLAFVDAETGALNRTIDLEGEPARGRLIDGDRLLVSFRDRRAVDVVRLTDEQVASIPLPAPATATVQTEDGRIFAAVPALEELVELDLATGDIARVRSFVGRTPVGLEATPEGKVFVAFQNDGITLELDPDQPERDTSTEWVLPGVPVRRVGQPVFAGSTVEVPFEELVDLPTPSSELQCANSYYAAPPQKPPCPLEPVEGILVATSTMVPTLRTVVARGEKTGKRPGSNTTRLRPAREKSALLVAQVASAYDGYLHLTLDEGSGAVLLSATNRAGEVATEAFGRLQAEAGSRDLALSRDGRRVYVYNDIERSFFAYRLPAPSFREPEEGPVPVLSAPMYRKVITEAELPPSVRRGAKLFVESSDRVSGTEQFSCASCHPGGGEDGMRWGTHFTMPLLSRRDTLPFHWNNEVAEPDDLNEITIQGRMGGTGLSTLEMTRLFSFIETLQAPVGLDPERDDVARGAALFHSDELACATCHAGPAFTDGMLRQVLPFGESTATPSLLGLAYTAPYMSDGSAQTLRQVVNDYVRSNLMGRGSDLDEAAVNDLVAYLRSL